MERPTLAEIGRWFGRSEEEMVRGQGFADSTEYFTLVVWIYERNEKER